MKTKMVEIQDVSIDELSDIISEKLFQKIKNHLSLSEETNDHDTYLTREQAAQYFSISLGTLWSWTKKGVIKSSRVGNRIYYLRADLKKAVRSNTISK